MLESEREFSKDDNTYLSLNGVFLSLAVLLQLMEMGLVSLNLLFWI